jgi:hypothetical protein
MRYVQGDGLTAEGRKRREQGETKAFTWTKYQDLLITARRQLPGGNVVLVWDNLNVYPGADLRGPGRCSSAARWPTSPLPASATWSRSSGTA